MTQKELHEKIKKLQIKAKNVDPDVIIAMCKHLEEIKEKRVNLKVTDKQLYKTIDL